MNATACVWSEDNLWELVLSSHLWVSETELGLLDSAATPLPIALSFWPSKVFK